LTLKEFEPHALIFLQRTEKESEKLLDEIGSNYLGLLKEYGISDIRFLSQLKRQAKKICPECWEAIFARELREILRVSANAQFAEQLKKFIATEKKYSSVELMASISKDNKPVLTFKEAAKLLDVTVTTLEKYVSKRAGVKQLPAYQPERKRYILLEDLVEWLKAHPLTA